MTQLYTTLQITQGWNSRGFIAARYRYRHLGCCSGHGLLHLIKTQRLKLLARLQLDQAIRHWFAKLEVPGAQLSLQDANLLLAGGWR
jgi:hypothetical protein